MVIEVPARSADKYEFDKETGMVKLDRVLPSSQVYPGDYGFIPQTLAEDGDPLDGVVVSRNASCSCLNCSICSRSAR